MSYRINYNIFYLFISILIFISYLLGFYFNEDAAGGGKIDLYGHEWDNINLFINSHLSSALTDVRYESARTPLYLIINKFNPFTANIQQFRISYLFFAMTIPILFLIFLAKNFKITNLSVFIFLSSILMINPYFRTMSFWADTEVLAIFFMILTLITLTSLLKLNHKDNKSQYYFYSILTGLLSTLSFYSDQKYIFLSIFVYFFLIFKNDLKFFILYSFLFLILITPALYLFYIWGGIVPIDSQFRVIYTPTGFNYFISSIGLYFIPICVVLIIEKKISKLLSNFKKVDLVIFLIVSIILFLALPNEPKFEGVGIIFKFFSLVSNKFNINWYLILSIYYIFNLFFLFLLLVLLKKDLKNYFFIIIYALIYAWSLVTYQQYVDPLFFILIFCYFNFIDEIKVINIKYIYAYFLFYFFMLFGALYYRENCSLYFLKAACEVL